MQQAKEVDEYIAKAPKDVQKILTDIRSVIRTAAPEAVERMGYGMPGYYFNGPLVYFAYWKKHIGFYATPVGNTVFEKELSGYKGAKGSVQFPLDQPMPLDLIKKIVKFKLEKNKQP